jgi:hypothetical protein
MSLKVPTMAEMLANGETTDVLVVQAVSMIVQRK